MASVLAGIPNKIQNSDFHKWHDLAIELLKNISINQTDREIKALLGTPSIWSSDPASLLPIPSTLFRGVGG